jgi:hypothetical protein
MAPTQTRPARFRLIVAVAAGMVLGPGGGRAGAQNTEPPPVEETPLLAPPQLHASHTNRLAHETSPYLLQHAHNPVDWYPWGPEAIAKAKAEDKPVFLSIGYSACHWCHVMERESFENEEIAAVLNAHFVSIKVDREERPDLDEIYMTAVQAMTGSGGWPMSVFLTPEMRPFYGGTYFPPDERFGRPGFKTLLTRIAEAWETRRAEVIDSAGKLSEHVSGLLTATLEQPGSISADLIANAARDLAAAYDAEDGGFGGAPKFPSAPSIQLLLREHARTGDAHTLDMATHTLDRMAQGGLYDQIGGGFARYSVDGQWLVPHFEKMLYDNAQLAEAYIEAWQATDNGFYKRIAQETLDYVLRDLRDARGGFHSSEDADSEGEEGKFYLWSVDEVVKVLGETDAKIAAAWYALGRGGNFDSHETSHRGMNILHTPRPAAAVAAELGLSPDAFEAKRKDLNQRLFDARSKRVRPGLDDKVLTSWNALMITALARGSQAFGEPRFLQAAAEAANFILRDMTRDGALLHTHRAGESRLPAYLDDYAFFAVALIDLYEADFDPRWLREADRLAARMIEKFWDDEHPGFYFTSADHADLLVRTRASQDGATPSGASAAALALLRLAKYRDTPAYYDRAQALLEAHHRYLAEAPRAFLKMMIAADFFVYPPREIAIVGPKDDPATRALLAAVRGRFLPNKILAWYDPAAPGAAELAKAIPLLEGKALVKGRPAAYVCENFACKQPVTTPEELLAQLGIK